MISKTTIWVASGAIGLASLGAVAQETAQGEDGMSGFRTFEPVEGELLNFAGSGDLAQTGGEAVYGAVCAGCHMPDGEGAQGAGIYPSLAENDLLAAPSYPIYVILEGQGAMPPLGGIMDDQQVADVVNYIRSSFGNDFIGEWGEATAEDVGETRQ